MRRTENKGGLAEIVTFAVMYKVIEIDQGNESASDILISCASRLA